MTVSLSFERPSPIRLRLHRQYEVLSLSFLPAAASGLSAQICAGESYQFDGQALTESGEYQATYTAANGCDSVVTLALEVTDSPASSFNDSFCSGESYNWNGQVYSTPGSYQQIFEAAGGCDSTVTLQLQALPAPSITGTPPASYSACEGEPLPAITLAPSGGATIDWYSAPSGGSPLLPGSNTFAPPAPGTYYAEARNPSTGCRSLQRLELAVEQYPNALTELSNTTCQQAGAGVDTSLYSTAQGCDSLVITTTTYQPPGPPTLAEATTCLESGAGVDTLQFQDAQGCDSTVILTTAYEPIPLTQVAEATCEWEAVGTDIQVFTTAEGCDSVVQYQYSFEPALVTALPDATSCDEAEWGSDTTFLTTPGGCDSLLVQQTLPAPPARERGGYYDLRRGRPALCRSADRQQRHLLRYPLHRGGLRQHHHAYAGNPVE